MNESKGRIETILEFRGNFLELLAVAVAIGLSINLIASLLAAALPNSWVLGISIALICASCTILVLRITPRINRRLSLSGMVIIDNNTGKIFGVEQYEFSKEVSGWFRALFKENRALELLWKNTPIIYDYGPGDQNEKSASKRLVREAIEYFALRRLTMDLSSHFHSAGLDRDELVFLERIDVPTVLLTNRFLDLLSRPVEERTTFSESPTRASDDTPAQGKMVYMVTADGAIFEHFELALPKGSQVTRLENGSVRISTKRFSLVLKVNFDGANDILPSDFEELFLGLKFDDVTAYRALIEMDIAFGIRALLSQRGWEYFSWIDTFLKNIERDFSFENFLQRIGWEFAHTIATVTKFQSRSAKNGRTSSFGRKRKDDEQQAEPE